MNKLTIYSDSPEEFDKVKEAIKSDRDDSALSFEAICPTPPKLKRSEEEQFHLDEWGCKWDIDEPEVAHENEKEIQFDFNTAWSPPMNIINQLEERYPDASFSIMFLEPGEGFAGEYGGGADFQYSNGDEGYDEFAKENFDYDC